MLNIKRSIRALNHLQLNGCVERLNRVLKEGVRAGKADGKPVDQTLRSVLANYRSPSHNTTGKSQSELIFGRRMKMPWDLLRLQPSSRRDRLECPQHYHPKDRHKWNTSGNRRPYFPYFGQCNIKQILHCPMASATIEVGPHLVTSSTDRRHAISRYSAPRRLDSVER